MNGIRAGEDGPGSLTLILLTRSMALFFSICFVPFSFAQQESEHHGSQYSQNPSGHQNSYEPLDPTTDPAHEQAIQGFQRVLEQQNAPGDPYAERPQENHFNQGYKDPRQGETLNPNDSYTRPEDRNHEPANGHEANPYLNPSYAPAHLPSQGPDPYRNSKPAENGEETGRTQHQNPNGEGYHY